MPAAFRLILITALAMTAFAANSVIARLALAEETAGPWGYTLIRIVAGAATLALIAGPARSWAAGGWGAAAALLAYAGFFSYAYLALEAGTGALILFACVQITMLGWGVAQGERLSGLQWAGALVAMAALVWLVSPGVSAPHPLAAAAMAAAGVAWGVYSLKGRGGGDPTAATSGNFLRASLIAAGLSPLMFLAAPEAAPSAAGGGLAVLSGAVTSGLGYAIWYTALKGLTATRAGLAQLTVPAIAAAGGVALLAEPLTLRFVLASLAILGGVGLATLTRSPGRD
ncbi:MAG: DMT family transporter [Pseudomonadota bacterium]